LPTWPAGCRADLITRQVPLDQREDAYLRRPDDIKAVLTLADAHAGRGVIGLWCPAYYAA
jgi:hypothetical protein